MPLPWVRVIGERCRGDPDNEQTGEQKRESFLQVHWLPLLQNADGPLVLTEFPLYPFVPLLTVNDGGFGAEYGRMSTLNTVRNADFIVR